jgi:hypothetical protein
MDEQQKKKIAKLILKGIQRQPFADWYNEGGDFDKYLTGEMTEEMKIDRKQATELILADIERLFLNNKTL